MASWHELPPRDIEAIADALELFAGIDDGENTDYDDLMRLVGVLRGSEESPADNDSFCCVVCSTVRDIEDSVRREDGDLVCPECDAAAAAKTMMEEAERRVQEAPTQDLRDFWLRMASHWAEVWADRLDDARSV